MKDSSQDWSYKDQSSRTPEEWFTAVQTLISAASTAFMSVAENARRCAEAIKRAADEMKEDE